MSYPTTRQMEARLQWDVTRAQRRRTGGSGNFGAGADARQAVRRFLPLPAYATAK
jgi:hypothetical protein